jgi:type IV fimbrial biogenesis protein FimT
MRSSHHGLTLLETLVALAAAAILCCLAFPALTAAAAKTRDASVRASLVESLQRATTYALVNGTRVVLCPSSDAVSCAAGIDWSHGWIAFADRDGDRERGDAEALVHAQAELDGVRLLGQASRARIVVQARGGTAGSNATFTICTRRDSAHATALVLANSGGWRFAKASEDAAGRCAYGGS